MCDLSVTTNKQEGNTEWVSLPHRSFLHLHMCHKSGQRITSNPRTGIPLFGTGVRCILPIFAHWQRPRSWGVCFLCHTSMQIIATSDAHVARNRQTDRHWDTQIHGYTDTRIHGYMDIQIHGYTDTDTQTVGHGAAQPDADRCDKLSLSWSLLLDLSVLSDCCCRRYGGLRRRSRAPSSSAAT